jgi:serine/threonine-protein kinase HipA
MELARRVGLDVARTEVTEALGHDVLLVKRFDRTSDGSRRMMVSALTILGLDEVMARYAAYHDLADVVRARFTEPTATRRELFSRAVFNICVGNTDDHARNHAAFWDGSMLTLTPAYDICPQLRAGGEAAQAMDGDRSGRVPVEPPRWLRRRSRYLPAHRVAGPRDQCPQIDVISTQWTDAADATQLTAAERDGLWGRQILNPYALDGYRPRRR